jgi:glycerophosphoryl diester phosphodiesterase
MTQDNILVLRHGENRTGNIRHMSNCDTVIWKENYQDLYETCNFGYNFIDETGDYPYRDLTTEEWILEEVYLTKLEDVFEEFGDTILYNIEIKADADSFRNETADHLFDLIEEYDLFDYVLVATNFHDISQYVINTYPELMISASHDKAQEIIIKSYGLIDLFLQPAGYYALQIPTSYGIPVINELQLDSKLLINRVHGHNMAVHYWTINDEKTMRYLISIEADGIITDDPILLMEILDEV